MIKKVVQFFDEEDYVALVRDLIHVAYEMYGEEMKGAFAVLKAADILFQAGDVEVKIE